jgi:hypothetical protein
MTTSYVISGMRPSALLAMAGWDKTALNLFWHERFTCVFPQRLVDLVAPQLPQLLKWRDDLGNHCPPSFVSFVTLMRYLAVVVLQVGRGPCRIE